MLNGNLKAAVDLQVKCLGFNPQSKTAYSLLPSLEAGKPGSQAKKQPNHWRFPILQSAAQTLPHAPLLHLLLINIHLIWCTGQGREHEGKQVYPLLLNFCNSKANYSDI